MTAVGRVVAQRILGLSPPAFVALAGVWLIARAAVAIAREQSRERIEVERIRAGRRPAQGVARAAVDEGAVRIARFVPHRRSGA
jgi:hypothetical protein